MDWLAFVIIGMIIGYMLGLTTVSAEAAILLKKNRDAIREYHNDALAGQHTLIWCIDGEHQFFGKKGASRSYCPHCDEIVRTRGEY